VRVASNGAKVPVAHASVDGEIKMIGYQGAVTRVNVEAEDLRITAEIPADAEACKEGDVVRLIWPTAAMIALEDGT
jgi:hypothetical protein